ncbi:hypothetical protein BSZ37_09790 [Rubrivirga marina]|uniref:Protein kinase domain-containing protein n=1 Tax=Rubrivirga marina TaxID=1196024 RepID=A0A271J7X5_9BACT|nr:hypothetical protein BSZ37_09790 [Rubrivirga marina]
MVTDAPDVRPFAEIARGPVATVYKAFDKASGSMVLLKRLHAADPERRARFAEEARLAAEVDHPNVVRVLHAGDDQLVAEWVEGEDLAGVVARCGALPPELAALVAREAALGLDAVHAAGVLHRDVSARNVMVGTEGAVKLTDFGLASLADARDDEVRGTLGTLAPEIVRGETADARSDLFSLGAVLVHALSGRAPFAGDGASDTLDAVLHDDPTAALAADPRVPDALTGVAAALLAKDPAARPPSAADAADRLSAALDALGTPDGEALAAFLADPSAYEPPARPAPAPPPAHSPDEPTEAAPVGMSRRPARSSRRRPRWPAALAVSGVVAFVAAVVLLNRPGSEPAAVAEEPTPVPVEIESGPPSPLSADGELVTPDDEFSTADEPLDDASVPDAPPAADPARTPSPRPSPTLPDDDPPARSQPTPPVASTDEPDVPAPAQMGTLTVSAQPWARVRLGDRDLGTTPVSAVSLPAGEHALTLVNPEFPPQTVRVRIAPGERTAASVSLWERVGRIDVEVFPWADVTVDGELWDTVPPQDRPLILAPGSHTLTFTNPAFPAPIVRTIRVAAGERRTIRVRMDED